MTRRANIDPVKRAAIWQAHDRRCIYSTERVDISELAIDHLIPLEGGDDILRGLQARELVSKAFDLNGFENLVPTNGPRNRQKSALALEDAPLVYFLQLAREKSDRAETLYKEAVERDRALNGFLQMQAAAERNGVTVDGIFEVMKHQNVGDVALRVAPAIEGAEIYAANSAIAASLMDMTFSLGGAGIEEVPLEGPKGDNIVVRTSNEFLQAKADGYFAVTQYAINMWTMADGTSEALKAVKNSKFAKNSEIRFPRINLANLDRWSSIWVTRNAPEGAPPEHLSCNTIAELVAAGFASINNQDEWCVDLDYESGFSTRLSEIMRADLDDDDHEEILVSAVAYAKGGTFRGGGAEMAKIKDGLLVPADIPDIEP